MHYAHVSAVRCQALLGVDVIILSLPAQVLPAWLSLHKVSVKPAECMWIWAHS